jgi:hypothetical protein
MGSWREQVFDSSFVTVLQRIGAQGMRCLVLKETESVSVLLGSFVEVESGDLCSKLTPVRAFC